MMYKQDALNQLSLLYYSDQPRKRQIAYERLYELLILLLPDKPEEK